MFDVKIADTSDRQKWDDYVSNNVYAWPYHLFAWKDAIEASYKHKTYYLLAENNGVVVGLLPLVHIKLPLLINSLTALPYCDIGNLLCDNKVVQDTIISRLFDLSKELDIKNIYLRGPVEHDFTNDKIKLLSTNKVRMILELPQNSEILLAGFKSKLRSQIRKAEKNGCVFRWGTDIDLIKFYNVFSNNMLRLGSPTHSYDWFRFLIKNYENRVKIGLVEFEGNVIAGCILLKLGDKISIPWASTLQKYNKLSPNMLMYWNALKYSSDAGLRYFDFGRSSLNEGTYKFKAQWGAKPYPIDWYKIDMQENNNNKQSGISSKGYIQEAWTKLPLRLANQLGPLIRKYIDL
ncbi:MAG: FemAB family XrtA/PEP-CTERM system-associated protein [Candidatus Thiodiazotropha sp.]